MKLVLFILGVSLISPLCAERYAASREDALQTDRQSLHEARQHYRDAVQVHGPRSREAMEARVRLRTSRHTFHDHRRAAHL